MKERPILFSAPMVRAILAGRKTQTRRVMSPQPTFEATYWHWGSHGWQDEKSGPMRSIQEDCKYGQPGDRLWGRETWAPCEAPALKGQVQFAADGAVGMNVSTNGGESWWSGRGHTVGISDNDRMGIWVGKPSRWRPSIHMPRKFSRLTLEVTGVRVERLQDISEEDAKAEGLTPITKDGGRTIKWGIPDRDGYPGDDNDGWPWEQWSVDPRVAYARLWDSINGERDGASSAANPWVWVVEFRRVEAARSAA